MYYGSKGAQTHIKQLYQNRRKNRRIFKQQEPIILRKSQREHVLEFRYTLSRKTDHKCPLKFQNRNRSKRSSPIDQQTTTHHAENHPGQTNDLNTICAITIQQNAYRQRPKTNLSARTDRDHNRTGWKP